MPAARTVTITRHPNQYNGRLVATVRSSNGYTAVWPFDWPTDLNTYIRRARAWAKHQGYALDVHDETGEVR